MTEEYDQNSAGADENGKTLTVPQDDVGDDEESDDGGDTGYVFQSSETQIDVRSYQWINFLYYVRKELNRS